MATAIISIKVDAETARLFSEASSEQRRKLELLLRLRLRELTARSPRSLNEMMDEIGSYAQAQGLTPELLDSLLHGE